MKARTLHHWPMAVTLCFCTGFTALAQVPVKSDSDRLRELEGLVQQLREQNHSLQERVGQLERDKARPTQTLPPAQAAAPGPVLGSQPFESKRLNVGLEGLYGVNEVNNGGNGDDWRVQVGIIYSLF